MRLGRPLVRVLVTFSWLERAPGTRGRRRRAARARSGLLQPKKVTWHAGFLVRLCHMNTPHRPRGAGFRSTAPFPRSGGIWNALIWRFGLQLLWEWSILVDLQSNFRAIAHLKVRNVGAWGLRRPRALETTFSNLWRRPPKNEKNAILCEKDAYCKLPM